MYWHRIDRKEEDLGDVENPAQSNASLRLDTKKLVTLQSTQFELMK